MNREKDLKIDEKGFIDINVRKTMGNAYRIINKRGETAIRVRTPGGRIPAKFLTLLQEISEEYGDGQVHLTTRQGFEISGIDYRDMEEVNEKIAPVIQELQKNIGVEMGDPKGGYPAAGTRNIIGCVGNRMCPYGNYNTTEFVREIEAAIFPNHYHFKVACTGCPNDCALAHMQDFGILGMGRVQYDEYKCVGCQECVKNCENRATGALSMKDGKVVRDVTKCVECGECVVRCPMQAWTRNPEKRYKLVIMGRTGKKDPRIAQLFLEGADRESIIKIIQNTYKYVEEHILPSPNKKGVTKEHIGYIVDRTGYHEFKRMALEGVELPEGCWVAPSLNWESRSPKLKAKQYNHWVE